MKKRLVSVLMIFALLSQFVIPFASAGAGASIGDLSVVSHKASTPGLSSVAYGNGFYVGVGANGKIYVSTNGTEWTPSSQLVQKDLYLNTIEFAEGVFVVGGGLSQVAKLYSSTDGVNWTERSLTGSPEFITKVRYLNGDFYALGYKGDAFSRPNKGLIYKSADGTSGWTPWGGEVDRATQPSTSYSSPMMLTDIALINGNYVVGSSIFQSVFYSTNNGATWTQKQLATGTNSVSELAVVGTKIYASVNGAAGYSSTDGINYVSDPVASNLVGSLTIGGTDYLYGNNGMFKKTSDQQNWTTINATGTFIKDFASDGAGAGVLLAANGAELMYAPDLEQWKSVNASYGAIAINNSGRYVVVGNTNSNPDEGTILTGDSWNTLTNQQVSPRPIAFKGVASNGSEYVAVGNGIGKSTDGITWTNTELPAFTKLPNYPEKDKLSSVAYGAGVYVAVGERERIMTSSDGVNWTSRKSAGANDFTKVAYLNGAFIALGYDSALYSEDGITWQSIAGKEDYYTYVSAAYSNGKYSMIAYDANYYAVVLTGSSLSSGSWTSSFLFSDPAAYMTLSDIAYGAGKYVIAASDPSKSDLPLVLESDDGSNWTVHEADILGAESYSQALLFSQGSFYLAGSNGVMAELSNTGTPAPTYTVTYNGNGNTGGAVPTDSAAYAQNDSVTVAGNTGALVKSGYTFSGWNTQANGSGTDYAAGSTYTMGTANATLYAKWAVAASAPTVTDGSASTLSSTTASASGKVNDNGANTTVSFEYGQTTSYGSEKAADVGAMISAGSGQQNVSATLSGLQPGAIYHVRIKAVNSAGTTYSTDMTLTTFPASNPTITPTTGSFDKNPAQQANVTTELTTNGYSLTSITSGGSPVDPSNYTLSGSTLTIKKEYLALQPTATKTLTLNFNSGTSQTLSIEITDTTPLPAAPSTPSLNPADDTGASAADGVTRNSTPTFTGTAEANAIVYLFKDLNNNGVLDSGELLGQDSADGSGNWEITSSQLTDGNYSIRAVAARTANNYGTASGSKTITIDTELPQVTNVVVPANGTYTTGQTLDFTVNTDRNVSVNTSGGTPRIELTIGNQTVYATYVSGGGSNALAFRYTVLSGDSDSNGITLGALSLNGSTITSLAGNDLTPTLNNVGNTAGILVATSSTKTMDSFTFAGLTPSVTGIIDEAAKTISVTVPHGTDVTALVPTIVHDGTGVVPASGVARDFTNSVTYTVKAQDNSTAVYTVTVTVAAAVPQPPAAPSSPAMLAQSDTGLSSADRVTRNTAPEFSGTGENGSTVYLFKDLNNDGVMDLNEELGSDVVSGGTWTITSSTLVDGTYSVKAIAYNADGYGPASSAVAVTIDTATPVVTSVSVPPSSTYHVGDTLTFTIHTDRNVFVDGGLGIPTLALNIGGKTVQASYLSGSGTTSLTFGYTIVSGDKEPNGIGIGALALNNGSIASTAGNNLDLTLNNVASTLGVLVAAGETKSVGSFTFAGLTPSVTGVVYEASRTIEVIVPYGTDVTALVPTIVHNGTDVVPSSGVVQDFSSPVVYTITAEDGSTANYTVQVTVASNTAKQALDFKFNSLSPVVTGIIDEGNHTITAIVPYGTDVTSLVPTFVHSGANVQPVSGTAQDFTVPVTYTVTAADGSTSAYTVTVLVAPASANAKLDSLTLSIGALTPVFSTDVKSYAVSVANSVSSISFLPHTQDQAASVSVNGTQVSGLSGVPVNLNVGSNTVTIVVRAADGITSETYTLTVTRAAAPTDPSPSPEGSSGSTGSPAPAPSNSTTQRIEVDVDLGGGNRVVTKTIVERTKTAAGTTDTVTLESDKTKTAVDQAVASGEPTIRVVIPDTADEVSETNVNLPLDSLRTIATNNKNLEIATRDVHISIPSGSLSALDENVYFRVVPIKEASKRTEVLNRVTGEPLVREASSSAGLNPFVVARPMTIETNLQSREVTLTLPLSGVELPSNPIERQAFLDSLAIYVEHGDGDRELLRGTVVDYDGSQSGLELTINKFSTFTILSWKGGNLQELLNQIESGASAGGNPSIEEKAAHNAYIQGYADGTFRPEASLTRAQLAVMVASLLGYDRSTVVTERTFPDVAPTNWAASSIAYVNERGYLIGDNNGSFRPDAAVTRAEMAALANRLKPLREALAPQAPFSDVASGHWAASAIAAARQEGLINGYADGTYRPTKAITRAEAVTLLNRVFGRLPLGGPIEPSWKDVASSYWAFGNIEEASRDHRFTIAEDGTERIAP